VLVQHNADQPKVREERLASRSLLNAAGLNSTTAAPSSVSRNPARTCSPEELASTTQLIAIMVRVGLRLAAFASLQDIPLTPCQTDSQKKKDYLYQTLTHWLRS